MSPDDELDADPIEGSGARDRPAWLPVTEEGHEPRPQQQAIITADTEAYPLRILAGAGTGKTFTMIRTIEHLIDEQGVSPSDILAITFTNKAADAMQEKLHAKLGADGYDVDAYTYHSICHRILSEYAYYAGLDPGFEIATDSDKYLLVLETLDDLEYRFVKPDVLDFGGYSSGIVQKLLSFVSAMKRSGIEPAALDSYLGSPQQLTALDTFPERITEAADSHLRGSSVATLDDDLDRMAEELRELQAECIDIYGSETALEGVGRTVFEMLAVMEETCGTLADALRRSDGGEELQHVHKLPAFLFGGYSSPPKGIPAVGFTFPGKLESYIETCKTARDLTDGYASYERQLADNNRIDFDDAIIKTVELLSDDDLGAEISGQWEYVFCDEFQDTDTLQFDLIEQLTPDGQLFIVGDDDQAIYGWRGAQIENIKSQLEDAFGESLTDRQLTENFRSRQPILDLANDTLGSLDDRVVEKTLTRFDEPDYQGDSVVTITAADEAEDSARQIRNAITHLLDGDADAIDTAYDPGDIAVLTKKHRHATPIVDALDDAGIPYDRAGGSAPESPGVKTVIAFLKALARPYEDEVSWNRVLLMRYRVHDADLRRLNRDGETLLDGLLSAELERFEQPERVREARDQIETLLEVRDRYSVSRLYRELKEETNIAWYLSEQERRDLKGLEQFITSFGDGSVQPTLDASFVEVLEQHDDIVEQGEENPAEQPELADDAVNVMTIYKSKGLDFPVVIIPELTASEWSPGERTYDALNAALREGPEAVLEEDFAKRDEREARRVLHVGLTRAKDMLLLSGAAEPDGGESPEEVPLEFIEAALPDRVPWTVGGVSFPIWDDIQASCPTATADWTDTFAATPSGNLQADITHRGVELDVEEARERVFELARSMLDGDLETAPLEDRSITIDSLATPASVAAAVRHSYTSLDTFAECERRHYLDHVVGAFEDRVESETGSEGASQREIGVLFHETAERAAEQALDDKTAWYDICERLATHHGFQDALDEAERCIDRFYECDARDWEVLSAERQFTLDVAGHTVTGVIDAIARKPDGELVVADYKATNRERSLEENLQLPLYLIACNEIFDREITTAGYVYVGSVTPPVQLRSFELDELDALEGQLVEQIEEAEDATYEDYTAGDHCQWCSHRSLPCSDEAELDD